LETGSQPFCLLRVNDDTRACHRALLRSATPLVRLACLSKTSLAS